MSSRNVIVFVCIRPDRNSSAMTRMAVRSLREKCGWDGPIVVLSDAPERLHVGDARVVSVDTGRHLSDYPQLQGYPRHWARLFKPFIGEHFDFSAYEKLLFLDSDILCDGSMEPVFDLIRGDVLYFSYAARRKWVDRDARPYANPSPFLTKRFDLSKYMDSDIYRQSECGVCSGIFGMKTEHQERFLGAWRDRILEYIAQGITAIDQMALNELLLEGVIPGVALPDEWVDYPLTPLTGCRDRRKLKSRDRFIFHHFNPFDGETKLQYMKLFYAFGELR